MNYNNILGDNIDTSTLNENIYGIDIPEICKGDTDNCGPTDCIIDDFCRLDNFFCSLNYLYPFNDNRFVTREMFNTIVGKNKFTSDLKKIVTKKGLPTKVDNDYNIKSTYTSDSQAIYRRDVGAQCLKNTLIQ